MPKETASSSVETTQAVPERKSKTYTNWDTFDKKFNLTPVTIVCSPLPMHPADEACKTRLIPTGDNVITHIRAEHGGGFKMTVREGAPSPWPGWKALENAGAELQSLHCEVCDRSVNLSVRDIRSHLRPHQGKFRGAYQAFKNQLNFNIQFNPPPASGDDDSDYIPYSE